jgi:hypothetical protein
MPAVPPEAVMPHVPPSAPATPASASLQSRLGRDGRHRTPHRRLRGPSAILRLEGAVLLGAAVVAYARMDASWWVFAAAFLVPDLAMVAYVAGSRLGAAAYNLAHTMALPMALGCVALVTDAAGLGAVALIWLAHIGMDRALGYGLKYPTGFRDTHLQRVA